MIVVVDGQPDQEWWLFNDELSLLLLIAVVNIEDGFWLDDVDVIMLVVEVCCCEEEFDSAIILADDDI